MKKNIYDIDTVGRSFLWAILLPIILVFTFELILAFFVQGDEIAYENLLQNKIILILITMTAQIAFLFIIIHFNKKTNIKNASKINLLGFRNILICFLIGILGNFLLSPIASCFTSLLDSIGYNLTDLPFEINTPLMLVVAIVLLCLVPAVLEELLFRGIILQGLRKYGDKKAIILSSVLFCLVHLSAEQFIFPLIFGMVMAYIVIKTGSIISSMIIHFTSNTFSILCYYFEFNITFEVETWQFILIAIAFVFVLWLLTWLLGKISKNVEKKNIENISQNIETTNIEELEKIQILEKVNNSSKMLKIAITVAVVIWLSNFAYYMII